MDIATIGFRADTSQLKAAQAELKGLSGAARAAEGAARSHSQAEAIAAGEIANMGRASKAAAGQVDGLGSAHRAAAGAANDNVAAHTRLARAAGLSATQQQLLTFQVTDFFTQVASGGSVMQAFVQQGGQMVGMFSSVRQVLVGLGAMVIGLAAAFPPVTAAVVAIGAAVAGLTYEINSTTDVAVGFGDVIGAVFSVLGDRIYQIAGPAIDAIGAGFKWLWDNIVAGVKWATNAFVNGWASAFTLLGTVIDTIPDMFRVAGEASANFFLRAVEYIVEAASGLIGKFYNHMAAQLADLGSMVGLDLSLGKIDTSLDVDFGRVDFGGEAAGRRVAADWAKGWNDALAQFSRDPAGEFFNDVRDEAIRRASEGMEKVGKSAGDAATNVKDLAAGIGQAGDATDALSRRLQQTADFLRDTFKGAINGIVQAFEDGKVTVKEFGEVALGVLGRIADKLLDSSFDALFGSFGGLGSVFGGGGLSSAASAAIGGSAGGLFAKGAAFTNGVVHEPTLFRYARGEAFGEMGEAGPEAVMPLTRMSDGNLGVQANVPQSRSSMPAELNINVNVSGARGNQEIKEMVTEGVKEGLEQFNEQVLPYRVNEIYNDPRVR